MLLINYYSLGPVIPQHVLYQSGNSLLLSIAAFKVGLIYPIGISITLHVCSFVWFIRYED